MDPPLTPTKLVVELVPETVPFVPSEELHENVEKVPEPPLGFAVKVVEVPAQIVDVPVIAPAVGNTPLPKLKLGPE